MFKLVLQKTEEPEIKLPISAGSLKKQEHSYTIQKINSKWLKDLNIGLAKKVT